MSREQLDRVIPPTADDETTTLYLGLQSVTGPTRVLFCRRDGEEGVLPHPGVGVSALDNTFSWGTHSVAGGLLLARGLLTHALGCGVADRHAAAFAVEVVRILPDDTWELHAAQIQAWAERRELQGLGGETA